MLSTYLPHNISLSILVTACRAARRAGKSQSRLESDVCKLRASGSYFRHVSACTLSSFHLENPLACASDQTNNPLRGLWTFQTQSFELSKGYILPNNSPARLGLREGLSIHLTSPQIINFRGWNMSRTHMDVLDSVVTAWIS